MRVDRRQSLLLIGAAALLCLLPACSVPGVPRNPPPASAPAGSSAPADGASPSSTPSGSPVPGDCGFTLEEGGDAKVEIGDGNDEITKDVKKAERFVDGFWQRHWDQCFSETKYRAPEKRSIYTADDRQTCEGTKMDPDNALYCADGHFVAYGRELIRRASTDDLGTPWVYLVVAHEWAHAMQQLLADGGYDAVVPNTLDAKHELQADCLAGATLWGLNYEGFLEWDEDDDVVVAKDLLAVSDDTEWTKVTPEGDVRTGGPLARIAAYQTGLGVDGIKSCFAGYR